MLSQYTNSPSPPRILGYNTYSPSSAVGSMALRSAQDRKSTVSNKNIKHENKYSVFVVCLLLFFVCFFVVVFFKSVHNIILFSVCSILYLFGFCADSQISTYVLKCRVSSGKI